MRIQYVFVSILFLMNLFSPAMGEGFASSNVIPRKILGFYDPKMFVDPNYSPLHLEAAMPLNHLGLEIVYRSIEEPLPSAQEMKGVRGILTWFSRLSSVPEPKSYCAWLKGQMTHGKKVVIFGDPGIFKDKKRRMIPECKTMFRMLGAEYLGSYSDNPLFFQWGTKDPSMVEFERKLQFNEGLKYSLYKVNSPASRVYLKIKRTDMDKSDSDLVFTTPHGGFVHDSYVDFKNKELGKVQWRIDPFRFFDEAFGTQGLPRPDTTTLNGRRIFYTHIDGDGIVNMSHIDWKSYSGEIILNEIFKKYPDIPITASIIAGYLDMPEYESERVLHLYRDIFSLPNVEVGSHGYAHPLIWSKGTLALKLPGYKFSAEKEITGSINMIQNLLRKEKVPKKVGIFLWTGDCVLNALDVSLAYKSGVLNINGGDTRFDKQNDSYAFVGPLGIIRGNGLQVYASMSNENVYTNLWEGPYYGFVDVIQTFKNTETPIRIKPIDIYYHYYGGERQASLQALKEVYQYALSQKIFPLFASDFSRIVDDFFKVEMESIPGGFRIHNGGTLKTIRFDNESRNVDLEKSKGVIGFSHSQKSLYVSLDESLVHELFLAQSNAGRPFVEEASFDVKHFEGNRQHLHFAKRGWFMSEAVLGGMTPNVTYRIRSGPDSFNTKSDAAGRLLLHFKTSERNGPEANVSVDVL